LTLVERDMNQEACREIIESLMQIQTPTRHDVDLLKVRVAGKHGLNRVIPNSQLIASLRFNERRKLLPLLKRKTTRTVSGVTVIAVMTKPWPCPHGAPCAYCPGGPAHGVPQSYTGHEPAALRGIQSHYDPFKQVTKRIQQLRSIGHVVDKAELIVMGGTFPSMPPGYQESFVKGCLDGLLGFQTTSIEDAKKRAETGRIRNVGMTVETRPDWARKDHVDHMLTLGVTRVELGVQNVYDDVYRLVKRGHTVRDVVEATRSIKDSGMKVVYHLMPGLPGSDFEKDLDGFRRIFSDPWFKPDMVKIYPCLVLQGTQVYRWWRGGKYTPYSTEEAARLVAEVKKTVPSWVRIMRVQRDIPAWLIKAGARKSNLRELALERLRSEGLRCRCIRCREAGHRWLKEHAEPDPEHIKITHIEEKASEGTDIFVSAEDPVNDVLVGYLRLRIPSETAHRPEVRGEACSIVRELHVYGSLVPVGHHSTKAWQHKGYGKLLLSEAERISSVDHGRPKVVVISALGTKRYYMRLGYRREGPYMSKTLQG
jgi:elongator complex protein 3